MVLNYIILLVLLLGIMAAVAYYFYISSKIPPVKIYEDNFDIEYLVNGVKLAFSNVLKENLREMNYTKYELDKKEHLRSELKKALKESAYGDRADKIFVKSYIKDIIQGKKYGINKETINQVINFDYPNELTSADKFEILVYVYSYVLRDENNNLYKTEGFSQMIKQYELNKPVRLKSGGKGYDITEAAIEHVFKEVMSKTELSYEDKLEIVAQRIFEKYKGFGPIDVLTETSVDGISGGVSGVPSNSYDISQKQMNEYGFSYDSIWIVFAGVSIRLSCLSFDSQSELERVCKNIYKYNSPGTLSESDGFIINIMKNGSRVVVVRPPFAESWCFWVRKFDSAPSVEPEKLLKDENAFIPINVVKWVIKGCQNIAITGAQGTGKTTFLKSFVRYIDEAFTLRIQETAFELNLRYTYPERNIATFQETSTVSSEAGLDLQKKTDGTVNIIGEAATDEATKWIIKTGSVASLFTMFTHHAKTTKALVIAVRNGLLGKGGFTNEKIAEEQVVQVLNIDIHLANVKGHRYIDRITEIIPIENHEYPILDVLESKKGLADSTMENLNKFFTLMTNKKLYDTKDIVTFENGKYIFKNMPSKHLMDEIKLHLPKGEEDLFINDLEKLSNVC